MGRRTQTITIEESGRDHGKVFVLTEMPATAADEWVTQATYLIARATEELKGAEEGSPLVALARLRALKDPSLRAWWDCVAYCHRPNHPPQKIVQGDGCQIEEIATINRLLMAVYELHTGFFSPDAGSTSDSPSSATHRASSATRTSPASSGR